MRLFDAGARGTEPAVVHDRVLTVANAITAARLLGLPLFVYLMVVRDAYGLAFATLVAVGSTDWVDGYVARRFDQVTRLGRVLDPMIDRALLATTALTLLAEGFLPLLVVVLVVGRDVVLLTVALVRFGGIPPIPVSREGKFATACLLIGIPGFLLGNMDWSQREFWLAAGQTVTVVGIGAYYAAGYQYARTARSIPRPTRRVD